MDTPEAPILTATAGSPLESLALEYQRRKGPSDKEAKEVEALKTRIKAELQRLFPEVKSVILTSPNMRVPLKMEAREGRQIKSKELREAHPEFWEAWSEPTLRWYLVQF